MLSTNLCHKTLPAEINKQYYNKKMQYQKDILAAHPDQNNGVDKGCQEINKNQRKVDLAYKIFVNCNCDGLSG